MAQEMKVAYNALIVGTGENDIHPNIVEREQNRLIRYFKIKLERGKTGPTIKTVDDAIKATNKIMHSAVGGYKRAINNGTPEEILIKRIDLMSKYRRMPEIWEEKERLKTKKPKAGIKVDMFVDNVVPEPESKPDPKITYMQINDREERKFFNQRKKFYVSEFEFNDSSDQMLLETVIADEVILRRLTNLKLNNENVDDKLIDTIQKRYRDNIKALGVSREQRIADDTGDKGNVSQLSASLDDKLEEIRKLSDLGKREIIIKKLIVDYSLVTIEDVFNLIEELEFMRQRALRPDMENLDPIPTINEMPAMAEIDAILRDMNKKELN